MPDQAGKRREHAYCSNSVVLLHVRHWPAGHMRSSTAQRRDMTCNKMQSSSENLPGLLVEQCPDGIIFADANGLIGFWNAAAERIFGHSSEQALGQSLDIIIPERLREKHWRGFNQAVQAGEVKHQGAAMPTKAVRRDGTSIYVELSFAVVLGADGTAL